MSSASLPHTHLPLNTPFAPPTPHPTHSNPSIPFQTINQPYQLPKSEPPHSDFSHLHSSWSPSPSYKQPRLDRSTRPNPQVFGHIPGVPVGQTWATRAEVSQAGVHAPYQAGISGTAQRGGAESIVMNGGYPDGDCGDIIWYMGSGGFHDWFSGKKSSIMTENQSLSKAGNRALQESSYTGLPIRVIRGSDDIRSPWAPLSGYRYDGLYQVTYDVTVTDPSGRTEFKCLIWRLERLNTTSYTIPVKPTFLYRSIEKIAIGQRRKQEEEDPDDPVSTCPFPPPRPPRPELTNHAKSTAQGASTSSQSNMPLGSIQNYQIRRPSTTSTTHPQMVSSQHRMPTKTPVSSQVKPPASFQPEESLKLRETLKHIKFTTKARAIVAPTSTNALPSQGGTVAASTACVTTSVPAPAAAPPHNQQAKPSSHVESCRVVQVSNPPPFRSHIASTGLVVTPSLQNHDQRTSSPLSDSDCSLSSSSPQVLDAPAASPPYNQQRESSSLFVKCCHDDEESDPPLPPFCSDMATNGRTITLPIQNHGQIPCSPPPISISGLNVVAAQVLDALSLSPSHESIDGKPLVNMEIDELLYPLPSDDFTFAGRFYDLSGETKTEDLDGTPCQDWNPMVKPTRCHPNAQMEIDLEPSVKLEPVDELEHYSFKDPLPVTSPVDTIAVDIKPNTSIGHQIHDQMVMSTNLSLDPKSTPHEPHTEHVSDQEVIQSTLAEIPNLKIDYMDPFMISLFESGRSIWLGGEVVKDQLDGVPIDHHQEEHKYFVGGFELIDDADDLNDFNEINEDLHYDHLID